MMNEGHNILSSSINILEYRQVESQQVLILLSGGSNPSTPTKGLFLNPTPFSGIG